MGTSWITCRADVRAVYEMIFKRLRGRQLDWVYQLPTLSLIDLQPLRESLMPDDGGNWEGHSPESALAQEREKQDRQQRLAEMKRKIDEDRARALEDARTDPPHEWWSHTNEFTDACRAAGRLRNWMSSTKAVEAWTSSSTRQNTKPNSSEQPLAQLQTFLLLGLRLASLIVRNNPSINSLRGACTRVDGDKNVGKST